MIKHQLLNTAERAALLAIPTLRDDLARRYLFEAQDIALIDSVGVPATDLGSRSSCACCGNPGCRWPSFSMILVRFRRN